jgi:hypothetical protein
MFCGFFRINFENFWVSFWEVARVSSFFFSFYFLFFIFILFLYIIYLLVFLEIHHLLMKWVRLGSSILSIYIIFNFSFLGF